MKLMIITILLGISALLAQDLKTTLKTPESFEKGTLVLEKESDKVIGKFTLEVKKPESDDVLELVAVDPAGKPKQTIILYDDGLHGDQIAGDGVYTGTTLFISHDKIKYYLKTREGNFNRQVFFEYVLFTW